MNARPQAIPIRPRPANGSSDHAAAATENQHHTAHNHQQQTDHTGTHHENDLSPAPLPNDQSNPFVAVEIAVDEHAPAHTFVDDQIDSNIQKLYHFLMGIPVMQLRRVAKEWDRRQYGLKKTIVARIYLYVLHKVNEEGMTLEDVLVTNSKLPNFESWASNIRQKVLWEKPPTGEELRKIVGGDTGPDEFDPDAEADPNRRFERGERIAVEAELSLSEFARLLLLIKELEPVKRAIFEARREVLHEHENQERLKFWENLVEPRFNDKRYMPELDIEGPFESVDARRMPSRYRKGPTLMEAFGTARQSFLVYLERWRRIGRGDPAMFSEVLPRNGRGGAISRTGKRALMIFKLLKCWTENEDVLLLGLTSRFAMGASVRGVRGNAAALPRKITDEDEDDTDVGSEVRSTARSKRRRRSSGREDESPEMGDYMRGVMQAMKIMADSRGVERPKTVQQREREEEEYQRQARMKKLQEQTSLLKSMEEARRMMREHDGDHELKRMAEVFYADVKQQFLRLQR